MRVNIGRLIWGFIIIIICELISRYICSLFGVSGILYTCIYSIVLSFAFSYIYFPIRKQIFKSPYFYRYWSVTFIALFAIEFIFTYIL